MMSCVHVVQTLLHILQTIISYSLMVVCLSVCLSLPVCLSVSHVTRPSTNPAYGCLKPVIMVIE